MLTTSLLFAQALQPKLSPNAILHYKITSVEKDFEGASDKVTRTINQAMPVRISVLKAQGGTASVSVVTGPLEVRGRSVGRDKTHAYDIDATNSVHGEPIALLGVVFPAGGARPGQSWSAKFRGSPPLTGGLVGNYKFTGQTIQDGQRVAVVSVKINSDVSCRIRGGGQLMVGALDGIVRSGKLHFDIAYFRPGSGGAMSMNSHVGLDYIVGP